MSVRRFGWAAILLATAAAVPLAAVPAGPPVATQAQGCPVGQHEDAQTPGFQCVPGWCPTGTLLDAVTGVCVAAPGVPPPPLR